jgi:aminoglycoside 3-N-acetyltransferase
MLSWLPTNFKRDVKSRLKTFRIAVARKTHGFSREDLVNMLHRLGVSRSDTLLVHSSLNEFSAFLGKPLDIISALQEAVGPTGTLLLPTLPFTGSAVEYVRTAKPFDVRRTPSQMGMLTELFRRMPGVSRSLHPTHPVAAWGANASGMIANHHLASTPCGKETPYGRLLDHNGKILFLGTDISVMTFFHAVEEIIETQMPFSPFSKEVFALESRDALGNTLSTRTRLFEPRYSRRRNIHKLVPELKRRKAWREMQLGGMKALLLRAQDVLEASLVLAKQGIFCYDE